MTRTYTRVSPDSTGDKIATDEVSDGGDVVGRQIVRLAGDVPAQLQAVLNAAPGASEYGAVVRVVGDVAIEVTALIAKIQELLVELKLKADLTETQPVSGPLTDTQLRAAPVVVSGSITSSGGATEATLAAVAASVDGLEGLATTLNTLVDGLEGFVDGLEGGIGAAADAAVLAGDAGSLSAKARLVTTQLSTALANLATLIGHVDGVETALATLNAKAFLTNTELRATPVPVSGTVGVTGVATESTLNAIGALIVTIQGYVDGIEAALATLNAKDFATQATLATLSATATTISGNVDGIETALTTIQGYVDGLESAFTTLNAKDFATQATLATLSATATTISGNVDGIEAALTAIQGFVDGLETAFATLNAKDFATQATLSAINTNTDGIEAALTTIQGYIDGLETILGTTADASSPTGSLHAKLRAVAESASVLDDWDESDRAKVNPIAGQAGVQGASGVVTASTQRVVLATNVNLPVSDDAQANGSFTTFGEVLQLPVAGYGTAVVEISGTWTGFVAFQYIGPAAIAFCLGYALDITNNQVILQATVNGLYAVPAAGFSKVGVFSGITSGTANVSVRASTGTYAVALSASIPISQSKTATAVSVAESASSGLLRASNVLRKSLSIRNDAATALYLGLGVAATTAMPIKIDPGAFYELPVPIYTGDINGIWTGTGGNARVLELI